MIKLKFIIYLVLIFSINTIFPQSFTNSLEKQKSKLAAKVKSEFLHAWYGYKKYAWGHDELKPLSKSFHDWYGVPLYMTPVDAMDAMYIMGLKSAADSTKEYIENHLSFDKNIFVKNFEITIRLLGGLISNYQITGDNKLLNLAVNLGNRLLPAFNSPTGMPYMFVNLKTGEVKGKVSNPAEIGTLLIEYGTLSKLTGIPIYYDKAKKALVELYKRRSPIGLVGSTINVETGEWIDSTSHISGGIDSYYEYLLKSWKLFDDKDCENMWKTSIKAVNKYLADNTANGLWFCQVNMYSGEKISSYYGALDAFFPAVLSLSGDTLRAKQLQNSSYRMWNLYGIEPEEIDYSNMKLIYPSYHLRPEIIESAYYLYFFTHNSKYLEMGKTFLSNLIKYCRVENGYAALENVETKKKSDTMESFFLAETMKYLYLIFAPPETLNLNKVIFNTEAHPIRRTW